MNDQNFIDAMKLQVVLTKLLPSKHVSFNQTFEQVCLKYVGVSEVSQLPFCLRSVIEKTGEFEDKELSRVVCQLQNKLLLDKIECV